MPLTTSIDDLFTAASQQTAGTAEGSETQPLYTGRYIAIFKPDATDDAIKQFLDGCSLKFASAASFDSQAVSFSDLGDAEVLTLPNLGMALVSAEGYAAAQSSNNNPAIASADGSGDGASGAPVASSPVASWEKRCLCTRMGRPP